MMISHGLQNPDDTYQTWPIVLCCWRGKLINSLSSRLSADNGKHMNDEIFGSFNLSGT